MQQLKVLKVSPTSDASHCQSFPSFPHILLAAPSCSALHAGKLHLRVWQHWWDLVILTHVYLSHARPAAANSQPKQRHRRSSSRPSRSWRCTCRRKRGARASPAPSTRSSMRCDVSNRWKVRLPSFGTFFPARSFMYSHRSHVIVHRRFWRLLHWQINRHFLR